MAVGPSNQSNPFLKGQKKKKKTYYIKRRNGWVTFSEKIGVLPSRTRNNQRRIRSKSCFLQQSRREDVIPDALKFLATFLRGMRIHPIDQHKNSFDSCCFGEKELFIEDPQAWRSCIVEKVLFVVVVPLLSVFFFSLFLFLFFLLFFFLFGGVKDGVIFLQIHLFIGGNDKEGNI